MTNQDKKRLLDAVLAELKRDPAARKTLAPVFEAAVRDYRWLVGYGLIDALRDLSRLSGRDFGMNISEVEIGNFTFVILFARHLVEHLEERFDPRAWN